MLDEAKAREFYVGFLGFSIDWEHRFADDAPLYMQISRDGCVIHLSEHYGDCVPGGALRIGTDDVDQMNRELLDKQYKYARPGVTHTPWHTREMTVKDPFGNRLVFSQAVVATEAAALPRDDSMTPVGLTAQWMAANRALETESAEPLYRDPFARALAGDVGFAIVAATRSVLGIADHAAPDPYLTIRTKFLDDGALAAMRDRGVAQVLMLAAGMDTRAFRIPWPAGVTLFEVDRDDIFDYKEAVLARLGAKPTCDRRVVRADLAHLWTGALLEAGFDSGRPAAIVMEGLLMYLDEAEVTALLASIRTIAREGSWIGLDVVNREILVSSYTAAYMKALADAGCPWKFGVDEPERLLGEYGWEAQVVVPGEPDANYGRWRFPTMPRSVPGMPRAFLVRGRKVD